MGEARQGISLSSKENWSDLMHAPPKCLSLCEMVKFSVQLETLFAFHQYLPDVLVGTVCEGEGMSL